MFRLKDGSLIQGDGYTLIGDVQYPLSYLSDLELAALGVSKFSPPSFDPRFYEWDGVQDDPTPRGVGDVRKSLKDVIAAERYQLEGVGVLWNGHITQTDRASRANYLGMVVSNSMGLRVNNSTYKFVDGPAALPNADVVSLAITVAQYIQSLYDKEKVFIEQLDALQTLEELKQFTWDFEVTPPTLAP